MTNPWFRLYSEFAFDPKVQVLTEVLQRRYVMVLCLHCDGKLENRPDDEIALALRVTRNEWIESRNELVTRALLDEKTFIPCGWDKRQYISDIKDPTNAERQRRYRERRYALRYDSVTSRLSDSDTDTETDKKEKLKKKKIQQGYSDQFEAFWKLYPPNGGSKFESWNSYQRALKEGAEHEKIIRGVEEFVRYLARSDREVPHATTWLNQKRWENDYAKLPSAGFQKPKPILGPASPKRKNVLIGTPEAEAEYAV